MIRPQADEVQFGILKSNSRQQGGVAWQERQLDLRFTTPFFFESVEGDFHVPQLQLIGPDFDLLDGNTTDRDKAVLIPFEVVLFGEVGGDLLDQIASQNFEHIVEAHFALQPKRTSRMKVLQRERLGPHFHPQKVQFEWRQIDAARQARPV